ncbi:class I SAM-dependent methyltransferase [bacterium]|nr:class I SAM-dependent methyltransferase [bacterium]
MSDVDATTENEELARLLGGELSEVAKFAAQLLERTGAYSVLCPACGSGECSAFLARRGFRVTAFDVSAHTCRRVTRTAGLLGVQVESFSDDIITPRRELRQFDAIFSHNTLHQMRPSQRHALLRSFYRALRMGGILVVSVLSMEDERYGYGREIEEDTFDSGSGDSIHFYSAPELHTELSEFFEVTQIEEMEETHRTYGGKQHYHLLVATGVKMD